MGSVHGAAGGLGPPLRAGEMPVRRVGVLSPVAGNIRGGAGVEECRRWLQLSVKDAPCLAIIEECGGILLTRSERLNEYVYKAELSHALTS